jgi:hypothetical protein
MVRRPGVISVSERWLLSLKLTFRKVLLYLNLGAAQHWRKTHFQDQHLGYFEVIPQ